VHDDLKSKELGLNAGVEFVRLVFWGRLIASRLSEISMNRALS